MKLSWHLHVISDEFGKICRNFSFSSPASRLSLKAALATCLSIYLALLLNFQDPFFAGFGCFLMLCPHSGVVLARAFQSVLGAILGGISGYIILGLFINDHFAFTVAIFATTSFFSYMMSGKKYSFFWYYALVNLLLAAIAGAVSPSTAIDITFFRIVNVILGICCYVLVAVIVFPDFAENDFLARFKKAHNDLYLCVVDVMRQYLLGKYSEGATFAKMDLIAKELSELGEQIGELKNEERIFGMSRLNFDIRMLNLKRISLSLREFYEYASSEKNRNFSFQNNFDACVGNVISIIEPAADFEYNEEHPYAEKLSSILTGFDSGREKEIYYNRKNEYQPEDVLLFLESLLLCKSLTPIEYSPSAVREEDRLEVEDGDAKEDECLNISFFGRKICSIDLMIVKFSMKSALAVIADFWIYFWFEIPGSATTVAISAITVTRPDIITTRHRSILRMTGCLAGVFCAFIFLAFGVQTTEIMFVCLFIVAFISGLIWIGDTGIAYFGYQMLIAYMFSVIPNSMPALDVTEPTQRAVAIVIGVFVAWLVMTFVFPDNLLRELCGRLRKKRDRLKGDVLSVARQFVPRGKNEAVVSANFAIEDYNSLLSLLAIVRDHREMDADDAAKMRFFMTDCIKIHRELESISGVSRDVIEYACALDPDLCHDVLLLVADAICIESGFEPSALERRIDDLSSRTTRFVKIQREKDLLKGKSMDFKLDVAHVLLSLRRFLDSARTIIPLEMKGTKSGF